jgi:hypothetical protein
MKWEKTSNKNIETEFRRLLYSVGIGNGINDLIDVVVGIPNIKEKRDFVIGWHEQDGVEE